MAGFRLLRPRELINTFKTRRASFHISIVTTLSVLIAGLMTGILVAVALAIILVYTPWPGLMKPSSGLPRCRGCRFTVCRAALLY